MIVGVSRRMFGEEFCIGKKRVKKENLDYDWTNNDVYVLCNLRTILSVRTNG